ncbi:hypothetical protein Dda_7350 [Drechslerella dactyloides]|uniref:Uncharacterized protein n=1 Tax=Drechslerella dactyloides TaxID=74499 RepID=A0AAD6ITV9_DREDA|nr:hypothetical protein Dda_7350 [Drechslerella dactyloides]
MASRWYRAVDGNHQSSTDKKKGRKQNEQKRRREEVKVKNAVKGGLVNSSKCNPASTAGRDDEQNRKNPEKLTAEN